MQSSVGPFRKTLRIVSSYLPELNFITIHYAYFIFTSLFSALIFWGSSTPFRSVSFTDALFLCSSAMTEAGLNTVNLSTLNTFQQFMLFFLIMIGSAIFVSTFVVLVRVNSFEKVFGEVVKERKQKRQLRRATPLSRSRTFFARGNAQSSTLSNPTAHVPKKNDPNDQEKAPTDENKERSSSSDLQDRHSAVAQDPSHNAEDKVTEEEQANASADLGRRPLRPMDPPLSRIRSKSPPIDTIPASPEDRIIFSSDTIFSRSAHNIPEAMKHSFFSFTGVGATASSTLRARTYSANGPYLARMPAMPTADRKPTDLFLPHSGWVSRNSHFHGLSIADRQRLGGYEYSAVLLLSFLVPVYFFAWQFLGCLSVGAWIANNRASTTRENGLNPWWVGAFNAVSAFNNSGMSLLDANMVAFQDSIFLLVSMGLFILAGNTGYPIFLRIIIWLMWKVTPDDDYWKDDKKTLRFLLDYPRRCYTNLFPAQHTWWLGIALLVLNGIDWAAFAILDIHNTSITSLTPGIEVIDGLFQALAVRSGGFYVVSISSLRIALQVLYVLMMYISAYPVVISIRNSNVYEERSLGIFAEDEDEGGKHKTDPASAATGRLPALRRRLTGLAVAPHREHRSYFVRQQVRAQLAHDAWWIALAVFLIMIIENSQFNDNPAVFSVFNVIFEVVSGYGCVGISVGVPWAAYSFCGAWHALSKLILVAVMIRGRHRGLPVAIDHAVQLPSTNLARAEEEDGRLRRSMSMRMMGAV